VVAIFGTTISPYLFFWQCSEEVEDIKTASGARPLRDDPREARSELTRIRWDTYVGMAFSNAIAFFIILSTAVTLHAKGVTSIETAADAASALRPIAGDFAFALFGIGIVATGLLALPVLAGSAAYAIAEAMGWKEGLEEKARDAKGFYAVITVATLTGLILTFSGLDPIKALFWSAVINGVIAVPLMVVIMLLAVRKGVMGQFPITLIQRIFGWGATAVMAAASVAMFVLM